jgi:Tfp pilus assembly protein PilO
MTGRDRMVLIGAVLLAVLAGAWLLIVSPERQQAGKLNTQIAEATSQLSTAEGQLANARSAQTQYAAAYASIVSLGKAVPASQEVPSLIYQLALASNQKRVEFSSIAAVAASSRSSSTATPAVAAAGFSQMPFTFIFNGSYFDLEHLFQQLNRFTLRTTAGSLQVSGRLLTIQSVKLAPVASSGSETGQASSGELSGTITATAYVLPAGQGVSGGATAASPTVPTTPTSSVAGASNSPATPAIARVTP